MSDHAIRLNAYIRRIRAEEREEIEARRLERRRRYGQGLGAIVLGNERWWDISVPAHVSEDGSFIAGYVIRRQDVLELLEWIRCDEARSEWEQINGICGRVLDALSASNESGVSDTCVSDPR